MIWDYKFFGLTGRIVEQIVSTWEPFTLYCGGGGQSGAVTIDPTIKTYFRDMMNDTGERTLNLSMYDLVNTATGSAGNPYSGDFSFNPTAALSFSGASPLGYMRGVWDDAIQQVTDLNPETFWKSAVDAAYSKLDKFSSIDFVSSLATVVSTLMTQVNTALSNANIESAVTAYETEKTPQFMRSVGRFAAGAADVNAVMSSAFIMGIAFMENEFANEVDNFRKQLKFQILGSMVSTTLENWLKAQLGRILNKDQMILSAPSLIAELEKLREGLFIDLARLRADIERLVIIAKQEQVDEQLRIDVSEAKWDLEAMVFATNLLGAAQGGTGYVPPAPSKTQSALSGAFGGAALGAGIGSIVPGVGTAIGAGIGALLGFGAGLLG